MKLLLVDANVVHARTPLQSPLLGQLTYLIQHHQVRAAITEVVIAEAVGNVRRDIDRELDDFSKWAKTNRPDDNLAEGIRGGLRQERDEFDQLFRGRLTEVGFATLGYPQVEHHELVKRAVERRRPNKDNGDGYRDTLNWFALMEQATDLGAGDEIVWVSQDKDFGKDGVLHSDLSGELTERQLSCTVRLESPRVVAIPS